MKRDIGRVGQPDDTAERPAARRWLWAGLGWLSVGTGFVGMFVPVLPSTVFFIIAAACFARSYPRWERWLLGLPRIGPLIREYRAGLGMPRRAKVWAISMIAIAISASLLLTRPPWVADVGALALAGIGIWYIAWRVPTRERVLEARLAAAQRDAAADRRP